ncbi:MAG: hypothetical protein ACKVP0_07410 [Pirellulaceae bacterium]
MSSLTIALVIYAANWTFAIEPSARPEPLRYRRVFVPADELSSQAKGMIPIKREEFERRVADWNATQPSALASHVRVEQAVYSARLQGNQFIDGSARLKVVYVSSDPALLPLGTTLALGKPHWDGQPLRPARLGTTPDGASVLLVEESGLFVVPWTVRGSAVEAEDATFDLFLPKAAVSRLVLQLPNNLTIESDVGIVSRLKSDAADSQLFPASATPIGNWLIELGGLTELRLRVRSASRIARNDGVVLVRESATHVLSPVDVSSEFSLQLDVHQTELASLKVEVDATTRIVGVRMGGAALPWREEPAGNQRQTKLQIELPEKLAGSGTIVTVSTIGSLVADQPWRLPRLRLPGSTWQEGIATLVTSPSLQVSNVQLADARQTSISPGSPTQPEQTCQFQYLSPLGQITVQAVREIPRLKVLGGLVVRHEASQLAATLSLDLSVDSGERFSVEGITSEDWIVDSVDTTPQDLLEERQIVPLEGRKFALRLRLARPLTSRQKTRLVIRAHRQLPAEGEVISATALRLLELQDVREEQYVVALRATDGSRDFQLSGDLDSFRMDPESAAPEELSLLDSSAAGILFKLDRQAEGFRVSLVPSDPRFTAAIESSAFAQQGRIEQRSIARIVPTSASITRLIVRSSGPIPASMRWRLVGAGDLGIVSQTLLPAQTPSELVGQRESVWELVLSRSTNQPLTLEAAWETPFSIRETLPLFSFPEAASQDGLVRVDTGPGVPVRLDTTGVKPVPALLAPAGRYSTVRGFFRYEPGRQARIQLLAASKDDNLPAAWANSCSLLSRYSLDGSATHEFTWRLENHGLDRFPFSLPEGVRPLQVSVNGEDVPVPPFDAMTRQHYVPLPEGRRSLVVTLAVATAASARKPVLEHHWTAPPITTPLRTLDRSWLVILPPGLRPVSDAANAEDTTSKSWHGLWKSRLTGDTAHTFTSSRAEQFEIPWSESEPLVIAVYSPGLVRIGSIALAIAAASLVAWFASRRLTLVLLLAALFAVVALLVPAAWSPLAAGVFWGCLSGILLNLVKPIATSRAAAPRLLSSTRTLMATNAAGAFLILSMVAGRLTVVYSAPVESSDEPPAIKSHRVIIPVDANQKPQGEYVYVSLDFYTLLYRAPEREQLPAWLLRSATYEMDAPEGGVAANLVIRLEIETLAAQAKVSLPFQRGEVHLLEGRSTLDGEAIPLDWNETGTRLRLGVERPGLYQLTLAFSVAAEQKDGTASWRVNIPKTPRTSLRIKSAIRPEDWIFPTPRGAKTKSSDATDLLVDLGATEVIQVSRIDRRRPVNDMTVAEQFVWWNVRPGSVTADVHIRVRAMTGRIGEIKVRTDPHLRLLPLENEPGISRVWVDEGDANTIHLTLAEPASDTVQFKGKFLLLDASGVGRLTLPLLEVVADKKIKQWQAISVGRESEISQDPQTPMVSVPPVDFVDNIGGAARPPTLAWEAAGQSPAFFIRPRDGLVRAKEIMEVSLGRHDAEVHYRADLSGIPPERFQETIDLPAGFRVKQAALLERDAILSFRSPAAQQSPLTIRRARSPGQKQELVIEGTMPLNAFLGQANTIRLPSLRSAASDGAIVRIYRTPASLAVIKSAVGIEKSSTPEGAPWDARLGHLVASYKSAPTSQVTLREFVAEVRPNDPAASFRLVTKMERTTARSWSAVVNCEVTLESGSLDTVRLEVPAEWSGPFEFIPPMDHQIVLLPGQTQRHLIIRPHQTQTTSLTFSIRGPLKLQTGETPHAPVPLPLDAVRTDSYLMLPSRIADENLQWKTSGLQALGAGESRDNQLVLKDFEVFRIVAPRLEANLLQLKDTRAGASIALADYVLRPGKDGNYWSKAIYYLIPGGIDEAELRLPAGSNLVQILINDSPAEIRAESGGAWKIRLRHDQLPQYIVVIYEHHQEVVASDVFQAIPPVWKGMSVNKTIWTLLPYRSPNRSQYSRNDFLLEAIGPRHAELTRLSAVISLLHDAGDTSVSGLSPKQLGAWLSLWRSEFTSANKAALLAAPRTSGNALPMPDDQIESHRHSLEAEFSAALSRYVDIPNDSASTALTGREDGPPSGQEQLTVFSGNSSAPLSVKVPGSPTNLLYRLGLAISLLLVSFAAAFLASSTHLSDFFATAPVYLLAMVILVFLILIPVSQITAIIPASAAIWFSFRRSWPTSSAVAPPSRTLHLSALRPIRP